MNNYAYIDGQNLYMNTKSYGWKINLVRFRVYLKEKYYVVVKYLVERNRLAKVLAPNKKSMSSLYRPLTPKYTDFLDRPDIKRKIAQ